MFQNFCVSNCDVVFMIACSASNVIRLLVPSEYVLGSGLTPRFEMVLRGGKFRLDSIWLNPQFFDCPVWFLDPRR